MALPPEPPGSAGELLDALASALRWPRSRPARLLLGSRAATISGAAICPTEDAIDELAEPGVAVLLALPPSSAFAKTGRRAYDVFLGDTPVDQWQRTERTIIDASELLTGGIGGFDQLLVEAAGLSDLGPWAAVDRDELKLVGFIPADALGVVRDAVFAAGAGRIGDYTGCSWSTTGTGTFRGGDHSNPTVGSAGTFEQVEEVRFETVLPAAARNAVVRAFVAAHPYEEPAYDVYPLRTPASVGIGRLAAGAADAAAVRDRLAAAVGGAAEIARAATPSGPNAVVTSGPAGAVLAELVGAGSDIGLLVCSAATDAEASLLAERGTTVVVIDRATMAGALGDRVATTLSRSTGLRVQLARSLRFPAAPAQEDTFVATPTQGGRHRLNFDGGSRGNPGPAAYGFVIVDPTGSELVRVGEVLGRTTNNVAEYTGLVRGLERALELGVRELSVRGDSELIVKQLKGEYRVKNADLKPLYEQACKLLERFDDTDVAHVYRADNSIADSLVNEALDA